MIVKVDQTNLLQAATIHSISWQESHRAFCSPTFIALHSPEHQLEYLQAKRDAGSQIYLLVEGEPIGIVSITGNLIEDLYILPERQRQGYGTKLLKYAIQKCEGTPTLWILENNQGAAKLYHRLGFQETGRKNHITDSLAELELSLVKNVEPHEGVQQSEPSSFEYTLESTPYAISCLEWKVDKPSALLILCHGFAGDKASSVIAAVAKKLAARNIRCVTFDWPGHGKSPASSQELSISNCLRDLDTVLSHSRIEGRPVYIFATSFGGYLAMLYQKSHPDAFEKIILRSPALRMPEIFEGFIREEQRERFRQGEALNFGFERELLLTNRFAKDLQEHPLYEGEIPGSPSIHIIQGDRDDVVNPSDTIAYAQRNHCSLTLVKGADHRYKNPGNLEQILSATEAFLFP